MSILYRGIMRNNKGAFLLEALLIVVILSISLTTITGSLVTSLRANVYGAHYSTAVILAENKLFQLMKDMKVRNSFTEEGSFEQPFDRYRYKITSKEVELKKRFDSISRVDVDVSWRTGRKEGGLSVATFLLRDKS